MKTRPFSGTTDPGIQQDEIAHAANNYDLCTKAARDEWGFEGFIMTDWTTTHNGPDCTAAGCIHAGNDMVMPGRIEDHENIRQALEDGSLKIQELKNCICHLVGDGVFLVFPRPR